MLSDKVSRENGTAVDFFFRHCKLPIYDNHKSLSILECFTCITLPFHPHNIYHLVSGTVYCDCDIHLCCDVLQFTVFHCTTPTNFGAVTYHIKWHRHKSARFSVGGHCLYLNKISPCHSMLWLMRLWVTQHYLFRIFYRVQLKNFEPLWCSSLCNAA